jgi:hypothetical protein
MRRLFYLFVGILIGGAAILTAFNFHIVKTDKGLELVPKASLGLGETYVDIRSFSAADWANHKQLAADIVAAEKAHILGDSAHQSIGDEIKLWIDKVRR